MFEQNCPPAVSPWRLEHGRDGGSRLGLGLGLVRGRPRPAGWGRGGGRALQLGGNGLKRGIRPGARFPASERGNSEVVFLPCYKKASQCFSSPVSAGSPPGLPWR